ncbi:MAG: DUF2752 domain-containing protein [Proteobacteria bacterium]|nr:DUF2752 domain-containing protein [Pseudomonadota bacterium]
MRPPEPRTLLCAAVVLTVAAVFAAGMTRLWLGLDLAVHAHWLPACPFLSLTGVPCPGCGTTRALLLLGQLELASAFRANPAAPLLLVAMAVWAARPVRVRARLRDTAAAVALSAVLGLWIAENLV